jgi:hypothetical protein
MTNSESNRRPITANMQQIIDRAANGTGRVGGLGCTSKALAALRVRGLVDPVTTELTAAGRARANA